MILARRKLILNALSAALAAVLLAASTPLRAQFTGFEQSQEPAKKLKKHAPPNPIAGPPPSIPPAYSIPVDVLGFAPPGPIYLGQRVNLVSLDFLDEDHLLFTFRVPGLLKRNPAYDEGADSAQHKLRVLVLALPLGNVVAEDLWTLHDRDRYLWPLVNGGFLLRNGNILSEGDLSLKLHPILRFPGSVTSLYLDPEAKYVVTNSYEPVESPPAASFTSPTGTGSKLAIDQISGQSIDATPNEEGAQSKDAEPENYVVRILERATGKVLLLSRSKAPVRLAINSTGYLQPLRQPGYAWELRLYHFDGSQNRITFVNSGCLPWVDFISDSLVMATLCTAEDTTQLLTLTTDGQELWRFNLPSGTIWPQFARSLNGLRLARESLAVDHPISASVPVEPDEIKYQRITVFNAANGSIALSAFAAPVMMEGGNFALSPSGRRAAVLNNNQILVWNLPPAPILAAPKTK